MANIYLQHVGDAFYNEREFIQEAKKIGFNRKLPITLASKIRSGDIIVFGKHYKDNRSGLDYFEVLGYGVVNGYSIPYNEEIINKLQSGGIVSYYEKFNEPLDINRGCGKYSIFGTMVVTDESALFNTIKEEGVKSIFVKGRFVEVNYKTKIRGVPFTRTLYVPNETQLKEIKSMLNLDNSENFNIDVNLITNYSQSKIKSKK